MKAKVVFLVLCLMFVMGNNSVFAWKATPRSYGVVVNNNLTVVGININGPAYQAGIRPGDIIVNATKEQLYTTDESTINITYKRNEDTHNTILTSRKLLDIAEMTTFLILDSAKTNYERLVKTLTFHPVISPLFPIQSADSNLKILSTFGTSTRKNVQNFPDYIVSVGGSGFGFTTLKTQGNFALADNGNNSLFKVNLGFQAEWSHLGGQSWANFPSSGILERKVVESLYDNP